MARTDLSSYNFTQFLNLDKATRNKLVHEFIQRQPQGKQAFKQWLGQELNKYLWPIEKNSYRQNSRHLLYFYNT